MKRSSVLGLLTTLSVLANFAWAAVPKDFQSDYRTGYDSGYTIGYDSGLASGKAEGTSVGTQKGQAAGFDKGWNETYPAAYDAAYNTSLPIGHLDGWEQGILEGFEAGLDWAPIILSPGVYSPGASNGTLSIAGSWLGYYDWSGSGTWLGGVIVHSGLFHQYNWSQHWYDEGYDAGHEKGNTIGHKVGYRLTYASAYAAAFEIGYQSGLTEGVTDGTDEGTDAGFTAGWDLGYDNAYSWGFYAGLDYAAFGEFYLPEYSAPNFALSRLAAVPEPATLTLLAPIVLAIVRRSHG